MIHLPILPVLVPLGAAIVCMFLHTSLRLQRIVSLAAALSLVPVAASLFSAVSGGEIFVYALGSWPAPYGIVLVLDRLAALMVGLTVAVAVPTLVYAVATGSDGRGLHFHPLWQFQIAGLCGAFLTGDLFNLFVFFEVLLLASYGLLAHGHGRLRAGAGVIYVVLNLAGSVGFLFAVAVLYGTLGTLNIADMALVMAEVPPENQALVRAGAAVLIAVFALKAALLPLCFWLPRVYSAATAPVAALFAIMTKVGVYSILRVTGIAFSGAFAADILDPWLLPLAALTIVAGTFGALAARRLGVIVANLVVISTGMLLASISTLSVDGIAAALYYLVNTTLVTAGFFLLAGRIAVARGEAGDELVQGPPVENPVLLGLAYLALAIAASGMPPLAGFVGKLMVMQALQPSEGAYAVWFVIVVSGLGVLLVLARAASVFFWEPRGEPAATTASHSAWPVAALLVLVFASPALIAGADRVAVYARATAEQLLSPQSYVGSVIADPESTEREERP